MVVEWEAYLRADVQVVKEARALLDKSPTHAQINDRKLKHWMATEHVELERAENRATREVEDAAIITTISKYNPALESKGRLTNNDMLEFLRRQKQQHPELRIGQNKRSCLVGKILAFAAAHPAVQLPVEEEDNDAEEEDMSEDDDAAAATATAAAATQVEIE
jgi:hypothetical protein